jgi:hypothetical protein
LDDSGMRREECSARETARSRVESAMVCGE